MEFAARQTARAHEHESCRAFARSAAQHRNAKHSGQALSTCSCADYEKSDGQCHARLWAAHAYRCWRSHREFGDLLQLLLARERDALGKYCLALWCNSIAKTGGAVKNRAMNRMKIFAILIGALLATVPVRGQE